MSPTLLLTVGLTLAACDDTSGPPEEGENPSTEGTLVVSTVTAGNEPDPDGYQLTVDGVAFRLLAPTETADVVLPAGPHTLALVGVAEHCSVLPGTSLEVVVAPQSRTSLAFEISCLLTGARISTSTTGLDLDPDGYRVEADGTDRATIATNSVARVSLVPGSRTVGLTGLAPNCTIDGPTTRTVTILDAEALSIDFMIVCTATSGVIGVVVKASGTDMESWYGAMLDGGETLRFVPTGPAYLTAVPAGDHVVSLVAPYNCTVETDPQSVTVTSGSLVRDTVEVTFLVACVRHFGTLQIIARTTGAIPQGEYTAWACPLSGIYCWDFLVGPLGRLAPNDTLTARAPLTTRRVELTGLPPNCSVQGPNPSPSFTLAAGSTRSIEFSVACDSP